MSNDEIRHIEMPGNMSAAHRAELTEKIGETLVKIEEHHRQHANRRVDFIDEQLQAAHAKIDAMTRSTSPKTAPEDVARVCHEVNRAYCASLGDTSQPAWADAPEWQRQSAITGVHFAVSNPDAPPSASHESWLAEKTRDGWKYGETKDAEAKTHPCFAPYDELPPEQRAKDYLFLAVVRSMTPAVQSSETQD